MARVGHRSLGSIASVLAFVGGMLLAPVPAVAAATCEVTNAGTGTTYDTLQAAVDASASGDTLEVRGTCVGRTIIRHAELRVQGVPTADDPPPTLDGDGSVRVLIVRSSSVVIRALTIANGKLGIGQWRGRVVLAGTTSVEGNTGEGGIFSGQRSTLVIKGAASVAENTAADSGGGVASKGKLILSGSASVTGNQATWGGGIFMGWGNLVMKGTSSVTGNSAMSGDSGGGVGDGIFSQGRAVLLTDAASVTDNRAELGGGIYVNSLGTTLSICSDEVAISPNDPDDPPKVRHVCP